MASVAVAEELLSCLQQLYLDKAITLLLHLVFVFTPAVEFSCQSKNLIANETNSFANRVKSFAYWTNSIT